MKDIREASVIEAPVWHTDYGARRFFMATEEERNDLKTRYPTLIIRACTEEEKDQLQGKSWEQMEQEEMRRLLAGG